MSELTMDELTVLLRECAGDAEEVDLETADASDISFVELGYDSLALLQVAGAVKRAYGVELPDDDVIGVETPQLLLQLINSGLRKEAA